MTTLNLTNKPIGPIGLGLMGMTWRNPPPPVDQSLEAMKTSLTQGANFWNAGELYGTPEFNSCHLINQYLTAHPSDADKIVLSIKGGLAPGEMRPDGSEKNLRRSIDECLRILDGKCGISIFQSARVDPQTPIETSISALAACVREGKIHGIGLSEVKASTIRRAAAIHPIAAVEVELSLWATDILRNGVAGTCAELGIPIVAYSPLCRGVLTERAIRRNADIPDGDFKKHLPKFQDDVLEANNRITDEVDKLAKKKGCSKAQVAIAWVRALSGRMVPAGPDGERVKLGTIIPIPGATTKERVVENTTVVTLSDEEMEEIADILRNNPIQGDRYGENMKAVTEG
jgi:pyridoxine 4-dehydrogenase